MMGEGKEREREKLWSQIFFCPGCEVQWADGETDGKASQPASRRKGDKRFWVVISLFLGRESASLGLRGAGARVVRQGC